MLIVAGNLFVAPAEVDAFLSDLRGTLPLGRSADGNLFLSFTLEDQRSGCVVALEIWRDQEALSTYSALPEIIAVGERWRAKMKNEAEIYQVDDERSS